MLFDLLSISVSILKVNYDISTGFDLTTRDSYQDSSRSFHEPYFSRKHVFHES